MKSRKAIPPLYFFVLLLLSIGMGRYLPVLRFIHRPSADAGFLMIGLGFAMGLWASTLFRRGKTTHKPYEKPTALIVSGPFRVTRNPMYLGMLLILVGVAILVGAVSAFLSPVLFFFASDRLFIPPEEESMKNAFGDSYIEYTRRVRRWL